MGRDALLRAVLEVVAGRPMTREALVEELRGRRGSVDRDRVDRLLQDDTAFAEVEAGVVHVPSLLEGTAWTVWVDAADARQGFVRTRPHLEVMTWWLIDGDVELLDETGAARCRLQVESMWLDDCDCDVVVGPDGWLANLAGGWATVEVVEAGLCWTACAVPPEPTTAQVAAMRAGFEAAARTTAVAGPRDRPSPPDPRYAVGDNPIHEALVADRRAFVDAPIPPLPALYEAAGLEERGSILAERGFDWEAHRACQDRDRLAVLYGLDDEQVDRVVRAVGACSTLLADSADGLRATGGERQRSAILLAAVLEDGAVAEAFWEESVQRGRSATELAHCADELSLDGVLPVGLAWIRARGLDLAGDAAGAVSLLEAAVTPECTHRPALIELAGFLADSGDARRAFALLGRAGVTEVAAGEDPFDELDEAQRLLDEVRGFALHRPRPAAGRNDRCPCGSGRKYKACHLGREQHPLEDRAAWLYDKAQRFLRRRAPGALEDLADEVADASDAPGLYRELRNSPWLADLALHEGGVFSEFVAERHGLLPDDEALLASQWTLVDRAVFEIRRAERGRLELYDIGRAERITVLNTTANERARKGVVLLGRPLPVGDTYRALSGFIEVPRARLDDVLRAIEDADPVEVAALVGRLLRPPHMQNTDGDELVFHTIRWRCPHPDRVGPALRAAGLNMDGDAAWSLVRDSANQPSTVIAHLRLVNRELSAEVNSDQRADEVRALMASAVADAELLEDEVRPFDELLADVDPDALPSRPDLDDPALRDALRQFVADHELRWLDESIPALGGRTPRQAALDPVGREQLEHLLDSFPSPGPDDVGMMDPDRLRTALSL
jgi:hypothetical protein